MTLIIDLPTILQKPCEAYDTRWLKQLQRELNDKSGLPDQSLLIRFQCPMCERSYDTLVEAEKCRDTPYDFAGLSVGTLVLIPSCREWHGYVNMEEVKADPWFAFKEPADLTSDSHFDHDDSFHHWWVVTALHGSKDTCRDRHDALVTVATLRGGVLQYGWNPANGDGHCTMLRPGVALSLQRSIVGSTHFDPEYCDEKTIARETKWLDTKPSEELKVQAAALAATGISTRQLLHWA